MEIKFIGTGGAFDYEYLNSSALLTMEGRTLLIDCGHAIYPALRKANKANEVTHLLVTHTHDDHVGSLSVLILHHHYFAPKKLTLLYQDEDFLNTLKSFFSHTLGDISEYVELQPLSEVDGITAIETTKHHVDYLRTFAFIFEENGQRIAYSGDLGDASILFEVLDKLPEKDTTVFHDIFFEKNISTHTYYKQLEKYLNRYAIFGYHCDPRKNPQDNPIPLVQNEPEFLLRGT
ncbi:MAG: MBL fold metallo-hydrolase [Bacteroidia bacterium]